MCVRVRVSLTHTNPSPCVVLGQTRSMNDLRGVGHDSHCSIIEYDRPVLASVNVKALVSVVPAPGTQRREELVVVVVL